MEDQMKSTTSSPSYLSRNPYSYCFRIKVPIDLQPTLSKKELRYSLKTGSLSRAKTMARLLAGQIQFLFKKIRRGYLTKMNLTKNQIHKILQKYLQNLIKEYDQPAKYDRYLEEHEFHSWASDKDAVDGTIDILNDMKAEYNVKMHSGDYAEVEPIAAQLLAEEGIAESDITKSSPVYHYLCSGLLKAKIKEFEYQQDRLSGNSANDLDKALEEVLPGSVHLKELDNDIDQRTLSSKKGSNGKKLSEVIPLFVDENKIKWTIKTKDDVVASLSRFIEVAGDVPIQLIDRAKVAEYKSVLKRLPPNRHKVKKYRNKSIPELMNMPIKKTLSVARVNKDLQRTGALFEYAITHGIYEGLNPATKMQLPKDKWDTDKRAPYTNEELEMLFRSEQYLQDSFSRHYMFWTPIIALFHGMRQKEIAGLFIEDIKLSEEGVWYFDLFSRKSNPREAQRAVAIHPFLIEELNFLKYVEKIKADGNKRLFPECKKGREGYGYGKAVSNWFNERYKKPCGIVSPDGRMRDFHSFRTTFITRLRHKKVHDRILKEVVGHSVHIDVTDTYTDPYPKKQHLDEVLSKASFHKEIDLSHLKNSKYVPK
jgi:integrase